MTEITTTAPIFHLSLPFTFDSGRIPFAVRNSITAIGLSPTSYLKYYQSILESSAVLAYY